MDAYIMYYIYIVLYDSHTCNVIHEDMRILTCTSFLFFSCPFGTCAFSCCDSSVKWCVTLCPDPGLPNRVGQQLQDLPEQECAQGVGRGGARRWPGGWLPASALGKTAL